VFYVANLIAKSPIKSAIKCSRILCIASIWRNRMLGDKTGL